MNKIKSLTNLLFYTCLVCFIITMISKYLIAIDPFGIRIIKISGNKYIDDTQVLKEIEEYTNNQNILEIKLKGMNSKLKKNEFIYTAKTYTKFPSSLFVEIEELTPLALFEKNGNFYFMDKSKTLIRANYESINHYINTPIVTNLSNQALNLEKIRYTLVEILDSSNSIYEKLNEVQYLADQMILILNNDTKIILKNQNYKNDLNKFLTFNKQIIVKNNINIENYKYIDVSIPEQIITRQKNI